MENGNRQRNRHVASHVPTHYALAPQAADHRAPAMTRILARPLIRALAFLVLISAFGASASAQPDPSLNRIKFLGDIAIETGETAVDVQCFMCSVHVRGHVTGDIITLGGGIFIDGQVDGDAIAIGGRIESNRNSKISGKAVAFGGYVNRQPDSVIAGNSESFAYLLIPGQYRPTFVGSVTLAIINVLFVAFGYLIVRDKRAETASLAIERRPASVFFTGIVSLAIFYGLDWLTRYLGHAEIVAVVILLLLLAAVAATGATGLGDWVARLAFPQTRGIWACIGGVLALSLLELIPLVGSLVFIIGLIVSLGASVVTRFGSLEVSEPVQAPR
jgi:hypothetical protein